MSDNETDETRLCGGHLVPRTPNDHKFSYEVKRNLMRYIQDVILRIHDQDLLFISADGTRGYPFTFEFKPDKSPYPTIEKIHTIATKSGFRVDLRKAKI